MRENGEATSGTLDWTVFDDPARLAFVESISERDALASPALDTIVALAASVAGTASAQLSLIGRTQFVPAAVGCTYSPETQHTPPRDSLCSVTMALNGTLAVADTLFDALVRDLPPVATGGVRSYLGVPIFDPGGYPIGALCAFDQSPRTWNEGQRLAVEGLASLVTRELALLAALDSSISVEVRMRKVIAEIVRSVDSADSRDLHARACYRSAAGAPSGGDWVDWVELDNDRTMFTIGDVAGSGLEAIVTMDETRHALRAYAIDRADPVSAIERAGHLLAVMRPEAMATAIVAMFDRSTNSVEFATAGHPPPLLVRRGACDFVRVYPSAPLGVRSTMPPSTSLALLDGDRLVLVTDGVFERRGEDLDLSLERLRSAVAYLSLRHDAADTASLLMEAMVGPSPIDDACVVVIDRRSSARPPA